MGNEDTQDQSIVEREVEQVTSLLERWLNWAHELVDTHLLTLTSIYQIAAAGAALMVALLLQRTFERILERISRDRSLGTLLQRLIRTVSAISMPVCWAAGIWIGRAVLDGLGYPGELLRLIGSLLNAFIVIRIASIFIPNARMSEVFAWFAWSVAALNAVGILDPFIGLLQATGLQIGEVRITLWTVVKGLLVSALLVWLAFVASEVVQRRLEASRTLNSALRLLISKLTRVILVIIAIVIGLTAVGVDLTAFAVFSGALGIGIGLGLQRTIANLVAGFSLLMDRSIKPGDVIELETVQGPTYGVVNKMTTRYASVRTRDGTETLVPNEILISNPLTNWSYSDKALRRKIPIGVAYDSDLDLVIALCLEAAGESGRILKTPKPVCLLKGFGDSSIDMELRVWINDPENGVANVLSEVQLCVWRKFQANGIEIPFPQRDINVQGSLNIKR